LTFLFFADWFPLPVVFDFDFDLDDFVSFLEEGFFGGEGFFFCFGGEGGSYNMIVVGGGGGGIGIGYPPLLFFLLLLEVFLPVFPLFLEVEPPEAGLLLFPPALPV